MAKLSDLKQRRAEKFAAMKQIFSKAETEKRDRTPEEVTNWQAFKSEYEALDKEIQDLEELEKFAGVVDVPEPGKGEKKEIQKMAKRFDLAKAIREYKQGGNFTGVEKEVLDEGKKEFAAMNQTAEGIIISEKFVKVQKPNLKLANETTTTGADHIPTEIKGLDIIVEESMYEKLGVTQYPSLTAAIKIPTSDGHDAAFVDEEVAAAESNPTNGVINLSIARVSGNKIYSNEYLAQSTVMPAMLSDMYRSINRAISGKLLNLAVKATVMAGKDTVDVAETLNRKKLLAFKSALNSSISEMGKFAMSHPLFYALEGTEQIAGAARWLIENAHCTGNPAFGTELLPGTDATHLDIVYGDWKRAHVGKWSGIQLVLDGITLAENGQTKIVFTQLANAAVDARAFISMRNIKEA